MASLNWIDLEGMVSRWKKTSDPISHARIVSRSLIWRPFAHILKMNILVNPDPPNLELCDRGSGGPGNWFEGDMFEDSMICPVCSAKVTRDVLNHITLQHLVKFQRRRRLRRVPVPNSQALSLLGKDLREAHFQALLGGSTYRSNNAASSNAAAVADPFLSSLGLNFTGSESEEISKSVMSSIEEVSSKSDALLPIWKSSSLDSSLSREEREERTRQAAGRAVFLQDLLVSTLFSD